MMKKQPHYEYSRELRKQTPEIQAEITAGVGKPGKGVIKPLTTKKKKPKTTAKKKKKKLTLLQKTRKRLKKVFGY